MSVKHRIQLLSALVDTKRLNGNLSNRTDAIPYLEANIEWFLECVKCLEWYAEGNHIQKLTPEVVEYISSLTDHDAEDKSYCVVNNDTTVERGHRAYKSLTGLDKYPEREEY